MIHSQLFEAASSTEELLFQTLQAFDKEMRFFQAEDKDLCDLETTIRHTEAMNIVRAQMDTNKPTLTYGVLFFSELGQEATNSQMLKKNTVCVTVDLSEEGLHCIFKLCDIVYLGSHYTVQSTLALLP